MTIVPRIDRYLAKLIFVPLLGTLCLAAMLLLLDRMLRLFDFVVSEGGPVNVVWRMLANLIPEYLGLAIPVGLTLGVLLAFRKLALSSELDTLRAIGLSYGRLLRIPYAYALVLLACNFFIVGFVQPYAQYQYQSLRFELSSGALGASIKVGEFTNLGHRMTLRVEHSANRGTRLQGVFLRMDQRNGRTLAVTADRGTFLATDDPNTILLRLTNGRLVHNAPNFRTPRVLRFVQHDLPINLPAIESFRSRGNGTKELTLRELIRIGDDPAQPRERRNAARANFHFRMVEVAMMLLVPLLAVALAVPPKRSTSGLGIFLAIIFVVTYHKVNQYAEQMGALGKFDPLIALWTPFLLFGGSILWMYWTLAHKPGGQPIGALERLFARVTKLFGRLLRRARRHELKGRGGMINLKFFPSRRITLYMARLFFTRSLAVLLSLVGILMMLDLLGQSGNILAHAGNGDAELWRYVGLRVPQLVARFLPFSVLLGTLITLAGLNQNSEIISMKAAGISAHQIIAPLILAASFIAMVNFAFNERVVTRATAALDAWDAVDYGPVPPGTDVRNNIALVHGDDLVFARLVSGEGQNVRLSGVTIYDRTGGTLHRILNADHGRYAPGQGWLLTNVNLFDVDAGTVQLMPRVIVGRDIEPIQFTLAQVNPNEENFWRLRHSIAQLRAADRATAQLESNLWHKLSGPFSTMLMPLLAATAAFGLARSGRLLMRAVIGMALGFAYFVADNFALAMGNLGAYPPFLAAWGPFLLFLLVGEAVLIRTEE